MIASGISGAVKKLKNFPAENLRASMMEILSSLAACIAAMRWIAPPSSAQTARQINR